MSPASKDLQDSCSPEVFGPADDAEAAQASNVTDNLTLYYVGPRSSDLRHIHELNIGRRYDANQRG